MVDCLIMQLPGQLPLFRALSRPGTIGDLLFGRNIFRHLCQAEPPAPVRKWQQRKAIELGPQMGYLGNILKTNENPRTTARECNGERSMAAPLEKQVLGLLHTGLDKKAVLARLATGKNRDELLAILNDLPTEQRRRQHIWINWMLLIFLFAVTSRKIYQVTILLMAAVSVNRFSPLMLLNLVVPAINFYILREIVLFHRQGYLFLAVVSMLALLRPENRVLPDLYLYPAMALLAVVLMLRLFPAREKLA